MKRLVLAGMAVGVVGVLSGSLGCDEQAGPAAAGPGGIIPGQRAAKRSVNRLFKMIRIEERDRAFVGIDKAHAPVLKCMQTLDGARKELVDALTEAGYVDLAEIVKRKTVTSAPDLIEVVLGSPKELDFKSDDRKAVLKVEATGPDGKKKQYWASMVREDISWRLALPLTNAPDAKPGSPTPDQTLAATEKAIAGIKTVMVDLTGRLKAGEMLEARAIREKLTAAARPLAAAMQAMIYGQTSIK